MISGYFGLVIDNNDPLKIGRLKVRVYGFYDAIDEAHIPWSLPKNIAFNRLDPPPINTEVQIEFLEGEIMTPIWFTYNGKSATDMGISDADYTKSAVLLYKDLAEYDSSGKVKIVFTESDGLIMEYEQDGKVSHINLRKDNTLFFKNSNFDKVIHISNESISLGTETKSKEPATLGETNHKALDLTNDTIKEVATIIDMFSKEMFTICDATAILKPLAPSHKKLGDMLTLKIINTLYKKNKDFYPKTKSEIVSLD